MTKTDNKLLETALQPQETALQWMDGSTPLAAIMGIQDDTGIDLAARILLRYTRAELDSLCRVRVIANNVESIQSIAHTFTEQDVGQFRID